MCFIGTEWPRVASEGDKSEKYAVYVPQNLAPYVRAVTGSEVIAQVTVSVPSLLLWIRCPAFTGSATLQS